MMLNTWTTAPTFMLLYLAGLQDIPRELYEAAAVDGANRWQQFRYVTVPQLKHITFLVMALGLIGTLQMFDQVAIIGSAAPLRFRHYPGLLRLLQHLPRAAPCPGWAWPARPP